MVPFNEVTSHLLVTLIYFLLVSVLKWKFDIDYLWLWMGAILGTFFLDIDHLIYWFVTHPEREDSEEASAIWARRGIRGIREIRGLLERYHQTHTRLIFHSVVGQAVLLVLALYILSSGGSIFASAFVMSINLHLLKDEWQAYFEDKEGLSDWLFWQIKGVPKEKYLSLYLVGVTVFFLVLTRFFI